MNKSFCEDILASLHFMFENPLDEVESIFTRSEIDAKRQSDWLLGKLEDKTEWSDKHDAIKHCMCLIKGNILNFSEFDIFKISLQISETVTDVRSALVKWGALFASALSQVMGQKFSDLVNFFVPNLYRQATHGTAIISLSCKLGILQIVNNCPSKKTLKAVFSELSSKSQARRLIVAESLRIINRDWPSGIVSGLQVEINDAEKKLKADPSLEVRNVFRDSYTSFVATKSLVRRSRSPITNIRKITSLKESRIPRRLTQLSSARRITPEKQSPPYTSDDALDYIKTLTAHMNINTPNTIKRMYPDLLEHLELSVKLISNNKFWGNILPDIFRKLQSYVLPIVPSLIVLTNFDDSVVTSALKHFKFSQILLQFTHDESAIKFCVLVNQKYNEVKITDKARYVMEKLVDEFPEDPGIQIIEDMLKRSLPSAEELISDSLDCIENGLSFSHILKLLCSVDSDKISSCLHKNERLYKFAKGKRSLAQGVLDFLTSITQKFPTIWIGRLILVFLRYVSDDNSPLQEKSEKLVANMLQNVDIENHIVPLFEEEEEIIQGLLIVLATSLRRCDKEYVISVHSSLKEYLLMYVVSQNLRERRAATECFMHISNAIGEDELSDLPEKTQILIQRLSDKWTINDDIDTV